MELISSPTPQGQRFALDNKYDSLSQFRTSALGSAEPQADKQIGVLKQHTGNSILRTLISIYLYCDRTTQMFGNNVLYTITEGPCGKSGSSSLRIGSHKSDIWAPRDTKVNTLNRRWLGWQPHARSRSMTRS